MIDQGQFDVPEYDSVGFKYFRVFTLKLRAIFRVKNVKKKRKMCILVQFWHFKMKYLKKKEICFEYDTETSQLS